MASPRVRLPVEFWVLLVFGIIFGLLFFVVPSRAAVLNDTLDQNSYAGSPLTNWGRTGANTISYSIKWTSQATVVVCAIYVDIGKQSGGSTGDVEVQLRGNDVNGGSPVIDTAFYLNAEIGDGLPKDFGTCHLIEAGTTHWFLLTRTSGNAEAPNALTANRGTANVESELWSYAGGVWTVEGGSPAEIHFALYGTVDTSGFPEYNSSTYGFVDPDFGLLGNALVTVARYLWIADDAPLSTMVSSTVHGMKYNAPAGYLTRFQELYQSSVVDQYQSASTSNFAYTVSVPSTTLSAAYTAPLLSKTSWQNAISSSTRDDIRTFSTYLFILTFLWWTYDMGILWSSQLST